MSVWETFREWHWTSCESSRCFLELWIGGMMRSDHTCTCLVDKPIHFSYTTDLAVSKKLSIHKPQVCALFHPLHIVLCCLQHLSPSLHFSVNEMKQPSGILQIANHHRNDCYDHLIWLTVIQECRQFRNYHSHFTDEKIKAQRDGKKKKKKPHHHTAEKPQKEDLCSHLESAICLSPVSLGFIDCGCLSGCWWLQRKTLRPEHS